MSVTECRGLLCSDRNLSNTTRHSTRLLLHFWEKKKKKIEAQCLELSPKRKNMRAIIFKHIWKVWYQFWNTDISKFTPHIEYRHYFFTLICKFKQLPHNMTSAKVFNISVIFQTKWIITNKCTGLHFMSLDLWHICQVGESQKAIKISDCFAYSFNLYIKI